MKMGWKTFNDRLAILLLVIIPVIWLQKWVDTPDTVNGALIATWTMVVQYYFRKAPPATGTEV